MGSCTSRVSRRFARACRRLTRIPSERPKSPRRDQTSRSVRSAVTPASDTVPMSAKIREVARSRTCPVEAVLHRTQTTGQLPPTTPTQLLAHMRNSRHIVVCASVSAFQPLGPPRQSRIRGRNRIQARPPVRQRDCRSPDRALTKS